MINMEKINRDVRERLRVANEKLMRKNGVDPTSEVYAWKKMLIQYAWDHNITVAEAKRHFSRDAYKDVEAQIGRPLFNKAKTGKKERPVQNPLTGEKWESIAALAKHLSLQPQRVRYAIAHKIRLLDSFYEFAAYE